MKSGRVQMRAKPMERQWANILREGDAHVLENVKLSDTTILDDPTDQRKLEIVAMNLPFAHGLTLGCDATISSPLQSNGLPRPGAARINGKANEDAVKRKHKTYPELLTSPMIRLKVLACETGGRWGGDTVELIRNLAAHKASKVPPELRAKTRQRWERRWWAMLSVAVQDAVAASLLNDGVFRTGLLYDGQPDFDEILADCQGGPIAPHFSRVR